MGIVYFGKLLFSLVLVSFNSLPILSLCFLIIQNGGLIFLYYKIDPFKDKFRKIKYYIQRTLLILIYVFCFIIQLEISKKESGFVMIFLSLGIILLEIINIVIYVGW